MSSRERPGVLKRLGAAIAGAGGVYQENTIGWPIPPLESDDMTVSASEETPNSLIVEPHPASLDIEHARDLEPGAGRRSATDAGLGSDVHDS